MSLYKLVALDLGLTRMAIATDVVWIYGGKAGCHRLPKPWRRVDKVCMAAAGKLIFESVQEDSIACSRLQ